MTAVREGNYDLTHRLAAVLLRHGCRPSLNRLRKGWYRVEADATEREMDFLIGELTHPAWWYADINFFDSLFMNWIRDPAVVEEHLNLRPQTHSSRGQP